MKKKEIQVGQYANDTKGFADDEFLDTTAPLIGYIVHSFNTLEELLNNAICQLFMDDADSTGLQVIYKLNYAAKVDLWKRIVTEEQTALQKKIPIFERLLSNLITAGRLRNTVVHADWESAHEDGYTLCKLKINSKGIQHEYVQFTPESLEKIIELIDETSEMFDIYEEERSEMFHENT